jgi:hypothetical protein
VSESTATVNPRGCASESRSCPGFSDLRQRPMAAGVTDLVWCGEVKLALYLDSQHRRVGPAVVATGVGPGSSPLGTSDPRRIPGVPGRHLHPRPLPPLRSPERLGGRGPVLSGHSCSVQPVRTLPGRSPGGGRQRRVHLDGSPSALIRARPSYGQAVAPFSYHQPMPLSCSFDAGRKARLGTRIPRSQSVLGFGHPGSSLDALSKEHRGVRE